MSGRSTIALLILMSITTHAPANTADISNYRAYSQIFASSGQPTAEQFDVIKKDGFERIIYIAYSDQDLSLPHEDRVVKNLGMEYVHIPVQWDAPNESDFHLFASAMQIDPHKKTLLHCQVNYRASAFSLLYRVLYGGVPLAQAKADMNSVWTPNATWTNFILTMLERSGVSADCEGCDWTPADPTN